MYMCVCVVLHVCWWGVGQRRHCIAQLRLFLCKVLRNLTSSNDLTHLHSHMRICTCIGALCMCVLSSFFMHAKVIGREVAQQLTFSIAIFTVLELLHLLMLHSHTHTHTFTYNYHVHTYKYMWH